MQQGRAAKKSRRKFLASHCFGLCTLTNQYLTLKANIGTKTNDNYSYLENLNFESGEGIVVGEL